VVRMLIVASLFLIGYASAQVVQVGPNDPNYCYKVEKIRPNLELRKQVHFFGLISDQTGAPFENSRIELRRYISQRKQIIVKVATTGTDGHFDLGLVKPGKYRFLASPTRAFKQPSALTCDRDVCEINIVLAANSTDQLDQSCLIR
jgi:hypothetical protein